MNIFDVLFILLLAWFLKGMWHMSTPPPRHPRAPRKDPSFGIPKDEDVS